ncbi:GMC family oxidoreductase N-terminal domain-containing protein [Thalassotalea psychrophila]|uniref:GMC family oxidoreductase N-terminal domain-containing protein n=1 Tax=Thalassotalea psychrophila TaxID=3065647 RepID=A0ABY9TS77_9GAMM|nr:GMC family oxidoreductase N-terminal domain-containing protein [Colwelliaceae bacterium SQ149]
MTDTYDFIIIGGGSAGCILANRLSECGKYTVCLIEPGGNNDNALVNIPIGTAALMRLNKFNFCFESTPQPQQNDRTIYNPRGKGLGGSSAINAMLYTRGQREDYDDWAKLGNTGWTYDDVLPYFINTESQERIVDKYHGQEGGLNVADSRSSHPIGADFIQAGINAGYPFNPDFNGAKQNGVGYYQTTQKDGLRFSAAKAFLSPITTRKNLTVLTHSKVSKILIKEKIAYGIQYQKQNSLLTLKANKEVILSAGAIHSPQLLMLSGIGDKEELEHLNINVEHDLKGVGKNLQDHVDAIIVNRHKRENLISLQPRPFINLAKQTIRFYKHRTGTMTSSLVESGGFTALNGDANSRADIQWQLIAGAMDDHGRNIKMFFEQGLSMHVCLLRPKSRGSVTLKDNDIDSTPLINSNLLSDQDDIKDMVKAVRLTRELMSTPPLNKNNRGEIFPGETVQTDEQIIEFLKSKSNNIYHPVGTCKMGKDSMAVVNERLQVHGVERLRVADGSIMPTIVSANTNAPCIMIGAKAADMILRDNK